MTWRMSPPLAKKRASIAASKSGGGVSATKYCARRNAMRLAVAGWRAKKRMACSPSLWPACSGLAG